MWVTNYCCDYDVGKILSLGFWILSFIFHRSHFSLSLRPTVNLDLTRPPTLLVKVDNVAVSLAPGAQVHSSSFSDVGLAGVGFRSADQNTDTRQQKGKQNLTLWWRTEKSPRLRQQTVVLMGKKSAFRKFCHTHSWWNKWIWTKNVKKKKANMEPVISWILDPYKFSLHLPRFYQKK